MILNDGITHAHNLWSYSLVYVSYRIPFETMLSHDLKEVSLDSLIYECTFYLLKVS